MRACVRACVCVCEIYIYIYIYIYRERERERETVHEDQKYVYNILTLLIKHRFRSNLQPTQDSTFTDSPISLFHKLSLTSEACSGDEGLALQD